MCQLIFLEKNKINEKVNKNKKNDIYKELENCNIEFTEKRNEIDKIVNVFKDVALFMKTNKLDWIVLN